MFRFFTQSDVEVQDNYLERYARVFRPTEIKMMLAAFANMETVHIAVYALLLETLGMPDAEFAAFMDYAAMREMSEPCNLPGKVRSIGKSDVEFAKVCAHHLIPRYVRVW